MIGLGKTTFSLGQVYFRANQILLFLVFLAFLYPVLTDLLNLNSTCQYEMIYGRSCRSCGLTRGLRECYSGNFDNALLLNKQSVFFFSAFVFQLTYRLGIYFLSSKMIQTDKHVKAFITVDLIILASLFITNKLIYG